MLENFSNWVAKSFKYLLRFGGQLTDVNYFDSRDQNEGMSATHVKVNRSTLMRNTNNGFMFITFAKCRRHSFFV